MKRFLKESNENIPVVNTEDYGDKLYLIGLWWGSGYILNQYKAYAFNTEEALNYVVAYLEQLDPELLERVDNYAESSLMEIAMEEGISEEEAEDTPEFQELYMYVDATTEGAQRTHYIFSQNLKIVQLEGVPESKKRQKLIVTESQLKQIVTESVKRILKESLETHELDKKAGKGFSDREFIRKYSGASEQELKARRKELLQRKQNLSIDEKREVKVITAYLRNKIFHEPLPWN